MKNKKAYGPDGTPAEMHKQGGEALSPTTTHHYEILETCTDSQLLEECQNHHHIKKKKTDWIAAFIMLLHFSPYLGRSSFAFLSTGSLSSLRTFYQNPNVVSEDSEVQQI